MRAAMRSLVRGFGTMLGISFAADAPRSIAALITASARQVSLPFRALGMRYLIDGMTTHDHHGAMLGAVLVTVTAALNRLMAWASFNVRMRLRENTQLYLDARLMAITAGIPGLEHHERPDYLDKVELIRSERDALANPFNPISWTVASIVAGVSAVGLLIGIHPLLALLPLFAVPSVVATVLAERASDQLRENHAEPARRQRHLFELATEAAAAKEIRIFGLAAELVRRRRRGFDELERARVRLATRTTAMATIGGALFGVGYVAGVALAVRLAMTGRASVGDVVLVLAIGAQLDQQLAELTENVSWLVHTYRAIQRLLWLIDHAASAKARLEPASPVPPPARLSRGIAFSGVSFAYPGTDKLILDKVDLVLPAGSTVAVVGENGAGKTTLVKLLCRFYEPTTGTITVDDVSLSRLPIDAWRSRISAGFQDFARLQLLARESVGVGEVEQRGGDAHVLAALERAAAADLPAALPQGLDTQLGREFKGGVDLSLGQWQKVALGRAMMRTAPLLVILDEPTASLDAATEHALFERFAGAARRAAGNAGAITLLISHRFSTVRMADLILVVAGGRIAEIGDHAALVGAGGLYAELYELQRRGYR
jgi:ABC-type multidrug transport system fused ATPase/permease subunit